MQECNGYEPLEPMSASTHKLFFKYDFPPFVSSVQRGRHPLRGLRQQVHEEGAFMDPSILDGLTHVQIAQSLSNPVASPCTADPRLGQLLHGRDLQVDQQQTRLGLQYASRQAGSQTTEAVSPQNTSRRARTGSPMARSTSSRPAVPQRRPASDVLRGQPWRPVALGVICLAGIAISIYLLIVHYEQGRPHLQHERRRELLQGAHQLVVCHPRHPRAHLRASSTSSPWALICLPLAWRFDAAWLAWGRVAAAVVGMGMVIYLVAQEALVLHTICLWCTGVHVLTFVMFLIIISGWEETGYAQSR